MNEIKDRWNEIKEIIRDEYDLGSITTSNRFNYLVGKLF